jgi:16S rRNA (cytosine1402-N4)-methyltransferase
MPQPNTTHESVLLRETIEWLSVEPGETVLDGTVGNAGHSQALCALLEGHGRLIGVDADADALALAASNLAGCTAHVDLIQSNFRHLGALLDERGISTIDKALFDLGIRTEQIFASQRGFSFQTDEPLLMTLADNPGPEDLTARQIVNQWGEESLADIIYGWGGEQKARQIAHAIVAARVAEPIETTGQLVKIIEGVVRRQGRTHPATKTFQALRIATNDELGALTAGLTAALHRLAPSGRLAVISFHSLEDRIVKNFFRTAKQSGRGEILTKKPIRPSLDERRRNPRSRSASLRVFKT